MACAGKESRPACWFLRLEPAFRRAFPRRSRGYGPTFGLSEKEMEQVARHKIAVLHLGNVRSHVIHKAKEVLAQVDIPVVVVAQCPMDMEDFAREGIKTRLSNRPSRTPRPKAR